MPPLTAAHPARRMQRSTQKPFPLPCSQSRASPSLRAKRRTRLSQLEGSSGHREDPWASQRETQPPQLSSPGRPAGNAHRRDCQTVRPLARRDAGPQPVIGWAGCALEGQSTRPPQKAPLAGPTCLHWLCCADSPSAFKDGGCPVPTSLSLRKAALLKAPVGTAQPVDARSPAVPGGTPRCKPTSSTDISTNITPPRETAIWRLL